MRIHFSEIRTRRTLKLRCSCGKRVTRTISVSHTVNPWNRDAGGNVKTRAQVADDVTRELEQEVSIVQANALCRSCEVTA
jgi:hypothetical protein